MLLAIHPAKNPDASDTPVFLRGFSWIVNPFEGGGVVVAIEIQTGAAVAGPFLVDREARTGRHDIPRDRPYQAAAPSTDTRFTSVPGKALVTGNFVTLMADSGVVLPQLRGTNLVWQLPKL